MAAKTLPDRDGLSAAETEWIAVLHCVVIVSWPFQIHWPSVGCGCCTDSWTRSVSWGTSDFPPDRRQRYPAYRISRCTCSTYGTSAGRGVSAIFSFLPCSSSSQRKVRKKLLSRHTR